MDSRGAGVVQRLPHPLPESSDESAPQPIGPISLGTKRAGERSAPDRFERQQFDFFERVRACYLARARLDATRYRIIDAAQSLEDVQRDIVKVLEQLVTV